MTPKLPFSSANAAREGLATTGYIASGEVATAVFLAAAMQKPLLIEGPPGVGKTELAKACAQVLGRPLVRLQCYEGLDEAKTLYEWKYAKQLLYTQMLSGRIGDLVESSADLREAAHRIAEQDDAFFSEEFLESRAILQAMRSDTPTVLLIDEVDRAEEELEAFFLEVLAENQVTVPELGTVVAKHPPLVFLTSNASRELSDALRRRCLHLHLDYPDSETERAIIGARLPGISERLRDHVVAFVAQLRELSLKKSPSISESIDWAQALVLLGAADLDAELVQRTLSALLKFRGDQELALEKLDGLLSNLSSESETA